MKTLNRTIRAVLLGTGLMGLYSVNGWSQAVTSLAPQASVLLNSSNTTVNITQKFTPRPSVKTKIDFNNWDHFLENIILYMGPAVRKRAPKVMESGTRIILRDDSAYRFEGNKVVYTLMRRDEKAWLRSYVADLQSLANKTDITTLSRDNQLAFWYNLHNAAVISHIADHYPVKYPERIKPLENDLTTLHDAKILNISGVGLSLRDIREKIVYPNWKNPLVIYGFHHGNLGGPSISTSAYDHSNLHYILRQNAAEFVNSLRGFYIGRISDFYRTTSPYYFPNGEADIRNHLKDHMRPEVYKEVESYKTLRWHKPLTQVADIAGGVGYGNSTSPVARVGQGGAAGLPPAFTEVVSAREERLFIARDRGYFNGEVTIEDIETDNIDLAAPGD